jgi:citrate lyase beta subunit
LKGERLGCVLGSRLGTAWWRTRITQLELEAALDAIILALEDAVGDLNKVSRADMPLIPQLNVKREELYRLINEAEQLRDMLTLSTLGWCL